MRIGIYNRHLATLGGGEKHMGVLAEVLSQEYEVDIITYDPIDKKLLEDRLNLDLSQVNIRCIPDITNDFGTQFTADYDLFINASYMSSLPSRAKKSVYLTYFPTPFDKYLGWSKNMAVKILGPLVKRIKNQADVVWGAGFYPRQLSRRGPYRWTAGKATALVYLSGKDKRTITLRLGGRRPAGISQPRIRVIIDGKESGDYVIPARRSVEYGIAASPRSDGQPVVVELISDTYCPADAGLSSDTRILGVPVLSISQRRGLAYYCQRLADITPPRLLAYPKKLDFLDTYDEIVAISEYTRYWVKRYWGRDSVIIFPPVDIVEFTPVPKENIIVSVGRFFAGRYNKKQLFMVKTFTELCKEGLTGWEYHLFGGTHVEKAHQRYFNKVVKAARGYPVHIHDNAPYDELKDFYKRAKIFWHASGCGENEEASPESFEHFGITTVEAMASGCVPVVIGKAGQKETVENGQSGFLWEDLAQMKEYTWRLVHDDSLRAHLAEKAIDRAKVFSKERFAADFKNLVKRLLSEKSGKK